MPRHTPVSTLMTRAVRTLDVGAKLSEARRALVAGDFHHLPVDDGERLVGIVSWRDLVRVYRDAAREPGETFDDVLDRSATLEAVMSRELVTLREDEPVERAIDRIADGSVHSVLVVDADDHLAGIVTDEDLVAYLSS